MTAPSLTANRDQAADTAKAIAVAPGRRSMTSPRRIQLRRARGWRLAEQSSDVVNVARPHKWGNPHPVGPSCPECGAEHDQAGAVAAYEWYLAEHPGLGELVAAALADLAGRDLACWCPPGMPCHADVLLRIANQTQVTR